MGLEGMEGTMFATLFVIMAALFVAVVGRAIIDPWPSAGTQDTDEPATDAEAISLMEAVALSCF